MEFGFVWSVRESIADSVFTFHLCVLLLWINGRYENNKGNAVITSMEYSHFQFIQDVELEKMKAGGNRNAREFFDDQPDWNDSLPIQQRYNSKAAALYRDKISTLAQGKSWSPSSSSAQNYQNSNVSSYESKSGNSGSFQSSNSYQDFGGYQDSGSGYQNMVNSPEFKEQKENYFSKIQDQNAMRPE